MYEGLGNVAGRAVYTTFMAFTYLEWLLLIAGSTLCAFVTRWVGEFFGIPSEPLFTGSLLSSGAPVAAIIAIVISIPVCIVIGSLIAASVGPEAGVLCCCVGLVAWSIRCGPVRPVLQYAAGPNVFLVMFLETIILAAIIFGAWFCVGMIRARIRSRGNIDLEVGGAEEIADGTISQKLQALGTQIVIMAFCELILLQTDAKAQALGSVGLSAFVSAMVAYHFNGILVARGIWYWTGPMVLGALGYLFNYFNSTGIAGGDVSGWGAALARATPLDYAGIGTAAALLGYLTTGRMIQAEQDESTETAATA